MVSFNILSTNETIFFLLIFIMSINFSKQEDNETQDNVTYCSYNDINSEYYLNNTDIKNDTKKYQCFSLSYNFGNQKCCYDTNLSICVKPENSNDNIECPNEGIIPNNCGMAGIYQPESESFCKEISLVQGYCCYTKYKKKDDNIEYHACLRAKKIMKNKNDPSDDIKKYIELFTNNNNIAIDSVSVICGNSNIKYFWILNIFFIILC